MAANALVFYTTTLPIPPIFSPYFSCHICHTPLLNLSAAEVAGDDPDIKKHVGSWYLHYPDTAESCSYVRSLVSGARI